MPDLGKRKCDPIEKVCQSIIEIITSLSQTPLHFISDVDPGILDDDGPTKISDPSPRQPEAAPGQITALL